MGILCINNSVFTSQNLVPVFTDSKWSSEVNVVSLANEVQWIMAWGAEALMFLMHFDSSYYILSCFMKQFNDFIPKSAVCFTLFFLECGSPIVSDGYARPEPTGLVTTT